MTHVLFEELLDCLMFDRFPESNRNFICDFIPGSEAMDTVAVTTKGDVSKVVREVEGATPEVVEVLAKDPKSPQTPRLKPTLTKESVKDKKGKQATILVHVSPRRNPQKDKPSSQEKGKSISLEMEEEEIEYIPTDDEDLGVEVEEVEVEGSNPITKFLEYAPSMQDQDQGAKGN